MVVKIIIEMVRMKLAGSEEGIGSLIEELEDPVESVELRMNILTQPENAKEKGAEVVETLRKYIEVLTPYFFSYAKEIQSSQVSEKFLMISGGTTARMGTRFLWRLLGERRVPGRFE